MDPSRANANTSEIESRTSMSGIEEQHLRSPSIQKGSQQPRLDGRRQFNGRIHHRHAVELWPFSMPISYGLMISKGSVSRFPT